MQKTLETHKVITRDERLHVPTKAEILNALQQDSSRGGLPLEWMMDRCDKREGKA